MRDPNEMTPVEPPVDHLAALIARSDAQAIAEREAQQRAAEWPGNVEAVLAAAVMRIRELDSRLNVLEKQVR